jgi:hypothetical protein
MATEEYSVGYEAGYQEALKQQPVQEPDLTTDRRLYLDLLHQLGVNGHEGAKAEIASLRVAAGLNATLPLPVQEPVAWMRPSEEGYDSAFRDHHTIVTCAGNPWKGWLPLYTAPPAAQRPWVGLTEDQIREIHTMSIGKDIGFATGLTEYKLKEKNTT